MKTDAESFQACYCLFKAAGIAMLNPTAERETGHLLLIYPQIGYIVCCFNALGLFLSIGNL